MAERDFGQLDATKFEDVRPASSNKALFITILATVFAISCFTVGFYTGEKHGLESGKGNQHETLVSKLQNQKQELESLRKEALNARQQEVRTSQVGELTFYNELPDQSINPEPLDAKPQVIAKPNSTFLDQLEAELKKDKQKKIADQQSSQKLEDIIKTQMQTTSRTFRIQVASFKEEQDAQQFLPRLERLGISAEVQRVKLGGLGVYYRVYSKSYMKEQDAMQAKELIKQKLFMTGILIQNG
ncbi:MAG: SPOR domain-containing protein [Ghiorsea sp.]